MKRTSQKISCTTYGGKIGWFLRTHFSKYTSYFYLKLQYQLRKKLFLSYIALFNKKTALNCPPLPCLISIETINRCNSTCEFCPANKNEDKRPFQKMDESLFHKIIQELKDLNYDGYLNLYVNNEPFMDTRIEDWYKYAKENLPQAKMLLYTNGTLITKKRFDKIIPYIDKMIINNYNSTLKLHSNIKELYDYIKQTPDYRKKDITIQIRYIKEILTNRAGFAPNKSYLDKNTELCIMPFTDITIYPSGIIGLCCSDAREKTNLGDVSKTSLQEIWQSPLYQDLRQKLARNRNLYPFCKGCDFVDAGIRNTFMRHALKSYKEKQNGK